jgi:peptidoglycan-N-acetylglucosamine deacetylase
MVYFVPANGIEEIAVALALITERLLAQDCLVEMRRQIGKLVELVGILAMLYRIAWTGETVRAIFSIMSITRGEFLKSLRKSIPGMVLGSGVATAAQKVLGKMAAASGAPVAKDFPAPSPTVAPNPKIAETAQGTKIEFITSGPPDGNRVALTFDDGPTPGITDRILDELKRRKLHATFFMIGLRIAAAPDLARRVLAEGHDVGNHTFTHPKLTTLPDHEVEAEIQKTQDILYEVLNHRGAWFRPPYGALRRNQAGIVQKAGLRVVLWNVDSADWSQPGEAKIAGTVLAETKPGSIILCHDMHRQTADGLGPILDGLFERGFAFATLSELLG